MDVVVSDTNIFIDLYSVSLLNEFFSLPFHIHTVDFVIGEIVDENQKEAILAFFTKKKLFIKKHSSMELQEIVALSESTQGKLSIIDCAVWKYAQTNHYRLLTGDKALRKNAAGAGVVVAGVLFVFDKLVEYGILEPHLAAEKLDNLLKYNSRLPKEEIENRVSKWRR
jgi:rRNA-processing protein FCF1